MHAHSDLKMHRETSEGGEKERTALCESCEEIYGVLTACRCELLGVHASATLFWRFAGPAGGGRAIVPKQHRTSISCSSRPPGTLGCAGR